jgi:hypothetical protein
MPFNLRAEELFEVAITVRPSEPFACRKSVLLIDRSTCLSGIALHRQAEVTVRSVGQIRQFCFIGKNAVIFER